MASMDIFNNDAFSLVTMSDAISRVPFKPNFLGSLGIFAPMPIRTKLFGIESKAGALDLIPLSERGAPLAGQGRDRRDMRFFQTYRIAEESTLYADEIQGIREFGSETELMQVQKEIANRLTGDFGLMNKVEATFENMRLGAIQGLFVDADGTVVKDYYTEFDITPLAEVSFGLDTATTDVRQKCTDLIRTLGKRAKGAFGAGVKLNALTGDEFHDKLKNHPTIRETYLNHAAAVELRNQAVGFDTNVWDSFTYGGITFHNYRGSDEGTKLSVPATKAKFFPSGVPGMFRHVQAPAEFLDFVNTPGRPVYALTVPDRDRNAWVKVEVYAYPTFICTRPDLLASGKV